MTFLAGDSQRPHTPAEVVAVPDEVRRRVVQFDLLGEAVGLALLAAVLMPIRPVVPLDEGCVDRRAHRRASQERVQQRQRTEDQRPHHLDDTPLLPPLPHGRVAQVRRQDLSRLGRPPRPRASRLRLVDAVDLLDGCLIGGVLVAGDQQVGPPPVRSRTCRMTCLQATPSRLPGTRHSRSRLSGSTAVWSQSSPRSRSSGSRGSHDFSF